MEENKREQYTFGPDEKEILNILGSFENELGDTYKDTKTQIKYYNNFTFNGKSIKGLENIFIVAEKDEEGKIIGYDIYTPDMKKIFSTDSKGNITESIDDDLEQILGKIDINELIKENEVIEKDANGQEMTRLKGISEKEEPKEMEKVLERKGEQKENNDEQEQDKETQKIEQDLEKQGEDLQISKYRKIKESNISKRMPDVFQDATENGIAFSNKLNRFVIISKVNGYYQLNENVEPARMTWKSIISIDPNGEKVERKVPHALMKTNREEKEIAVTIGDYGEVDIETVDVLPCQERVARQVRVDKEGINAEEKEYTEQIIDDSGKEVPHDLAHLSEVLEKEYKVTNTSLEEYERIKTVDDLENLIEEEADRVKMSKAEFKSYVKSADGETLKEKIDNAQEEIVQEYMGRSRPR